MRETIDEKTTVARGYVPVNGFEMYYEIEDRPPSIEQYARDVVALLKHLGVARADFFGFSFGGSTATHGPFRPREEMTD